MAHPVQQIGDSVWHINREHQETDLMANLGGRSYERHRENKKQNSHVDSRTRILGQQEIQWKRCVRHRDESSRLGKRDHSPYKMCPVGSSTLPRRQKWLAPASWQRSWTVDRAQHVCGSADQLY